MIELKEYNFINQNRLIDNCIINKEDINYIITNPTNVKFNIKYPAYINGVCYFKADNTLEEKLIFSTTFLEGHWILNDLGMVIYLYNFMQEIESKYDNLIINKIDLRYSTKSIFKL